MKKSYFNFLVVSSFLSLLLLSFISCASLPGEHAPSVKNAREGHYDKSLKYLEEHRKKVYGKKSDVLYYLDTGLLQHYQGEWTESINKLSAAEDEIYDLYTKSITTAIASFILNDNVLEYSGEDYEDIYLNVFNSLNYYYDGKIEDAVVETNRAINKITALQNKYQQQLIKARSAAKLETKSKDIKSIAFHDSALAEYLRMLYCRAIGDYDGASTNQRMIKDAFVTQKALYNFSLPETIEEELSVPKGKARLNLLAFSGLSPVKTEIIIRDYGLADFC